MFMGLSAGNQRARVKSAMPPPAMYEERSSDESDERPFYAQAMELFLNEKDASV